MKEKKIKVLNQNSFSLSLENFDNISFSVEILNYLKENYEKKEEIDNGVKTLVLDKDAFPLCSFFTSISNIIINQRKSRSMYVIAFDGSSCSGKTTVASLLSSSFDIPVVSVDDFYLPFSQRTMEREKEKGGNIHRERLIREVLKPMKAGKKEIKYKCYDCSTDTLKNERVIKIENLLIVEGTYSHLFYFSPYLDYKVFFSLNEKEQDKRVKKREGEERFLSFKEKWIKKEKEYFQFYNTEKNADYVLKLN